MSHAVEIVEAQDTVEIVRVMSYAVETVEAWGCELCMKMKLKIKKRGGPIGFHINDREVILYSNTLGKNK